MSYGPGSRYRPFREHDQLRVANAVLTHWSSGRTLELGALLVKRDHRESDTVLLTTGLELGIDGKALAEAYFARWPIQERWFKAGGAVRLDRHRGNSSQVVINLGVVAKQERLQKRLTTAVERAERLETEEAEQAAVAKAAREEQEQLAGVQERLAVVAESAEGGIAGVFAQAGAVTLSEQVEQREATAVKAEATAIATKVRRAAIEAEVKELSQKAAALEPLKKIRQLDVALDQVLMATKLTCMQLMLFVLREYLTTNNLTPQTFAARVLPLRGRREKRPEDEQVIFYENPRDEAVTEVVRAACDKLNGLGLTRDGRALRYSMEPSPQQRGAGLPVQLN